MASIGEQIRAARKARGLTQEALARELNVTRSAVANWEQDRRLPDGETLLRLSSALAYSFESAEPLPLSSPVPTPEEPAADTASVSDAPVSPDESTAAVPDQVPELPPEEGVSPAASDAPKTPVHPGKSRALRYILPGAALAAIVLLACLIFFPLSAPSSTEPNPYTALDGQSYTMEQLREPVRNESGKAYLRITTSLTSNPSGSRPYWNFSFQCREINGIGLTVDTVESVFFYKPPKENRTYVDTSETMSFMKLSNVIPAFGTSWSYDGGMPADDDLCGVGILLTCTDDNGAHLQFHAYIPFSL